MTSALNRLKLLGDRADQLTRWQADAELQERARARCDAERKERERTGIQTNPAHGALHRVGAGSFPKFLAFLINTDWPGHLSAL